MKNFEGKEGFVEKLMTTALVGISTISDNIDKLNDENADLLLTIISVLAVLDEVASDDLTRKMVVEMCKIGKDVVEHFKNGIKGKDILTVRKVTYLKIVGDLATIVSYLKNNGVNKKEFVDFDVCIMMLAFDEEFRK